MEQSNYSFNNLIFGGVNYSVNLFSSETINKTNKTNIETNTIKKLNTIETNTIKKPKTSKTNNTTYSLATNNIRQQLFQLNNYSIEELKLKYFQLFNTKSPNYNKTLLIKAIAFKIQSLACSSEVSEEEILQLQVVVKQKYNEFQLNNNINLPINSIIKKIYKNKEYFIKYLQPKQFEYKGNIYKSLSAIATEITGTKWNGKLFFGLIKKSNSGVQNE